MTEIPRIIHQTWKTREIPEHWQESQDEWKKMGKYGFQYILWTDEDNRALIKTDYPWFLKKFDDYPYPIQRADAVRYFILHKYGGVYSDLDIVPDVDKFIHIFNAYKDSDIVLTESHRDNHFAGQIITNAFMMSKAGSNFWPHVWDMLEHPAQVNWWKKILMWFSYYFHVLMSTGPAMLSDATLTYENPKDIVVLPAGIIPSAMNQENIDYDTEDASVTKTLRGSSWHTSDASFWWNLRYIGKWKTVIVLGIIFLCVVIAVIAWKKYKNCQRSKK